MDKNKRKRRKRNTKRNKLKKPRKKSRKHRKKSRKRRRKKGGVATKIEWIVENTQHNINSFHNSNLPDKGIGLARLITEMKNMDYRFFIIEWNAHNEPHHLFNRYHPSVDDRDLNDILEHYPHLNNAIRFIG